MKDEGGKEPLDLKLRTKSFALRIIRMYAALPKSVENLLEFAMLKSLSEKLRIASVERQGTKIALRFHPETNLEPAAVVKVVRSRKGIKLDPSGVLWMELERGEPVATALRNVLLGLRGEG